MITEIMQIHGSRLGLKADDLRAHSAPFMRAGMVAVPSRVVGVSYFDEFARTNNLHPQSPQASCWRAGITTELLELNREIISAAEPGVPLAVRSSSLGERGGSGIYHTEFIVLRGELNADLQLLWLAQQRIYASEFSGDAKAYRLKHRTDFGMALLIQPVVGKMWKGERGEDFFSPILAGSAYTTYEGEPLVRLAVGLGVRAVSQDLEAGLVTTPQQSLTLDKILAWQKRNGTMAINLTKGRVEKTGFLPPGLTLDPVLQLIPALAAAKAGGGRDYYLEWACAGGPKVENVLLQVAPYEDKPIEALPPIEITDKTLLGSGTDIVNHGRKKGIAIVAISMLSEKTQRTLEWINRELRNFVLVVPQVLFSGAMRKSISYAHFSNACVVVEQQLAVSKEEARIRERAGLPVIDHTKGRGGQHFQQLCQRDDILFIGTGNINMESLGQGREVAEGLKIWEVATETVNDRTQGLGQVFLIGKPREVEFTPTEITSFCDELRSAANRLTDDPETNKIADVFYRVSYALPFYKLIGFDPYAVNLSDITREDLIEAINFILHGEGWDHIELMEWGSSEDNRLAQYLKKLLEKLQA